MKKLGTYLLYGGALVFAVALVYMSFGSGKKTESSNTGISAQENNSNAPKVQNSKPAEKVQVFVFHSANRCYSCIAMGQYTKDTVEQKFPEELKSGKIEFKEINVDLPANREVAAKFRAAGSSLFINPIIDGKDNIKEEIQPWRLLGNKQAFSDYLSEKIKQIL